MGSITSKPEARTLVRNMQTMSKFPSPPSSFDRPEVEAIDAVRELASRHEPPAPAEATIHIHTTTLHRDRRRAANEDSPQIGRRRGKLR